MHLLMLIATFCWATNIIAGKEALRGFGALVLAQMRVSGAAVIYALLFVAFARRSSLGGRRANGRLSGLWRCSVLL